MARPVEQIVIHCSASPDGRWTTAADIDRWHAERGFLRQPQWLVRQNPRLTSIGYHFVIYLNGATASGRHLDEVGAHAQGHNARSIGVCLIGTSRFSARQWAALADLVAKLRERYPEARVLGHRDLPHVAKECPGFDVSAWLAAPLAVTAAHLHEET